MTRLLTVNKFVIYLVLIAFRSMLETWVTEHTGHIGNTFGLNGLSISTLREGLVRILSECPVCSVGGATEAHGRSLPLRQSLTQASRLAADPQGSVQGRLGS